MLLLVRNAQAVLFLQVSLVPQFQRFSRMTTEKETGAKVDLGLLEEDDEFEEFPADGE